MSDLYFGYGSNLDYEDWAAFCRARGFDPHGLRPVGPATLPDEMLVFDYRSLRRQCGALNIRAQPGGAVDGYFFAVSQQGGRHSTSRKATRPAIGARPSTYSIRPAS